MEEIKNVAEETMVEEAVEVVVEPKTNFLTKAGAVVKKHGKKIAVAGAAVIGVGLLVTKALLKKDDGDHYESDCDQDFECDDEIEVEETIE